MRHLDDFDLRPGRESPGDPGNPRRPSPRPPGEPAQRSSLPGPDPDSPAADTGFGGRSAEPDLRRYSRGGPAWDEEAAPVEDEEAAALLPPPEPRRAVRAPRDASPRTSSRAAGIGITLAIAIALVLGFWLMSRRVEPPQPGTVASEEPSPAAPDAAGDETRRSAHLESPLPALGESDALVRELVGALSSNPALARWLGNGALIRTFAAAVENASLGATPKTILAFLEPREPYRVVEWKGANGTALVPDPESYRRYDAVAAVFTSVDPQATADVYRRLHGLVQEAFAELGYPDESFDTALATAFETLLDTPIPATAPVLERHLNSFHYADPRLEALQPVQKQLLRMGPDHARRIQEQIRKLATAMDLPID